MSGHKTWAAMAGSKAAHSGLIGDLPSQSTVKVFLLPVPLGVVTAIAPVTAPVGTVAVI